MAVVTAELESAKGHVEAQEKKATCQGACAENWKMIAESAQEEREDATIKALQKTKTVSS